MKYVKAAAILLLFLATLFGSGFFFHPGDLLGAASCDMGNSYFPWRAFGFTALKNGTIPFWNPYVLCGTPFAANPETALFYPLNWIFLFVSPAQGINISVILHLFLCGWFSFLLFDLYGCSFWPAILGCLVYMMGGNTLPRVFAGHLSNICTMTWLPALIFAAELILERVTPPRIGLLALTYGFFILAGHMQYVFFLSLFLMCFGLVRLLYVDKRATKACAIVGAVCLGIGLSAVQLSLTLEMLKESARKSLTFDFCSTFSWDPFYAWTFLMPGYSLIEPDLGNWGNWYPWEMIVFIGVLPLLFSLFCFVPKAAWRQGFPRPEVVPAFGICTGLFILVALGRYTPLFQVLFYTIPGFNLFRGMCKFLVPVFLCLAALTALGCEHFFRQVSSGNRSIRWFFLGVLCLLVGISSYQVSRLTENQGAVWEIEATQNITGDGNYWLDKNLTNPSERPKVIRHFRQQVQRLAFFCFLSFALLMICSEKPRFIPVLVFFTFFDLLVAFGGFIVLQQSHNLHFPPIQSFRHSPDISSFRFGFSTDYQSANFALIDQFFTPLGYESNPPMRIAKLFNALLKRDFHETPLFTLPPDPFGAAMLSMKFIQNGGKLIGLTACPSRFRFYFSAHVATDSFEIWKTIYARHPALENEVFLCATPGQETALSIMASSSSVALEATATITLLHQSPERLSLQVAPTQSGWLFVNDTFAKGWKARIDQQPQEIFAANYAFRAVPVGSGTHLVEFTYTPPGFRRGLFVTMISLLAVFLLLFRKPAAEKDIPR